MNKLRDNQHIQQIAHFICLPTTRLILWAILILTTLASIGIFSIEHARASSVANILLISSYHPGYRWDDRVIDGIRETVLDAEPETRIFVEHLDSKRFPKLSLSGQIADLIAAKYERIDLDVVVTADNNAFDFLKHYRQRLFADTPVVFCGINDLNPADLKSHTAITGVAEAADVGATINLVLSLIPTTRRIVIINDTTTTGRNVNREIRRVVDDFKERVSFSFLDDLPREDLLHELSGLKTGDVVLYSFFFRDRDGRFYEYDDSARRICSSSPVPVFGLWEFNLGHGIVGGKLVSGFEQGKAAGEMALQIINGAVADEIPLKMKSPNRFVFDYHVLKKYGIDATHLPPDSLITNRPASFYQVNKPIIWSGFLVVATLIVFIAILLANIEKRRNIEFRLKRSERQMAQIINFLPDPTFVIDKKSRVIAWNRAIEEVTGIEAKEMLGKGDYAYAIPFYGERRPVLIDLVGKWDDEIADSYRDIQRIGNRLLSETRKPHRFLGNRYFKNIAGPLYDETGTVVGAIEIIHDITDRRAAEDSLAHSESLLRILVENTPAAVAMCDTKMNYLAYSRRWIIDYHLPDEDLRGRCHYDVFQNIPEHWRAQHQRCFQGEVIDNEEEPFLRIDGTQDWVRRSLHPWRQKDGEIGGLILFTEVVTQKKQAEDEIKRNERMLRRIMDIVPSMIFVKNAHGRYLMANQVVADKYGMPLDELVGCLQADIHPDPDQVQRYLKDDQKALHSDRPVLISEEPFQDHTGATRWLEVTKVPCDEADFGEPAVVGLAADITARREAEVALVDAHRMLRLVMDTIPVRVFWKDTECRYLGCNQPFAEDAGKSDPDQLIGKDDYAFPWGPDQADLYRRDDLAVMASGEPRINFEEPQTTPDGTTIWLQTSKVPIRDRQNNVIGVLGTYQDITKRKKAEEELRRLRNYLVNIINSMPSILVGVDLEGRVTQWNQQAEKMTGLSFEMAQSRRLADVFPGLMNEMDRIQTAIKDRCVLKDPKVSYQKDGETRFEDVTIFPLVANGVEGAVIRVDDVTERVRLEEMMIQSEKMLSVGGLAAGMAHEINNPLAGIMQNAAVLENRLLGELPANEKAAEAAGTTTSAIKDYMEQRQLHRMLENIRTSSERAAAIVRNILSFSRKSDRIVSSHDLRVLMDETVELARTDYDMKKHYDFRQIRIVREYADTVEPVPCEKSKIQQVFLNILKNGAEAMTDSMTDREKPTFILKIEDDDSWGRVEIVDSGPGMDEKIRRRIFEPFFSTKPVGKGTGLGLSVSYFIITENHSGEMDVFSETGKGTRFVIRLPKSRTG